MNTSLVGFANYYDVNSLSGLAQKAKKHWPPPPPISIRSVLSVLGLPQQVQFYDNSTDGVKQQGLNFWLSWIDPGAGTPVAATSWDWNIAEVDPHPGSLTSGATPVASAGPVTFSKNATYNWNVAPKNAYGSGPSTYLQIEALIAGPTSGTTSPTITASIASNDQVTIVGQNFNKSQAVNIQATVIGGPNTPPLAATMASDDRSQYPQATADAGGSFKAVVQPQGFPPTLFETGQQAYVLQGETIAVVAKNSNVGSFSPGPGVSNVASFTASATV
jgi:hypothetical protein